MPRGGARLGAGRKPKDPSKSAEKKVARGFTAPNGEKTEDAPKDWPFGRQAPEQPPETPPEDQGKKTFATPLEYWQYVLADPSASASAKHAAAYSMAPYVHAKIAPAAKKEEAASRAKKASTGKFGPAPAPLKLVRK